MDLAAKVLQGARVLCVDDAPESLKHLRVILANQGAIVTECTSAESAIMALKDNIFDVVISDLVMPTGLDGYDLAHALRTMEEEDPTRRATPTLAVSGDLGQVSTKRRYADFQVYMQKPANQARLIDVLARLVDADGEAVKHGSLQGWEKTQEPMSEEVRNGPLNPYIEKIMKIWEERARREIEAAPGYTSSILRNSLPEYLLRLSKAMGEAAGLQKNLHQPDEKKINPLGAIHGRVRADDTHYTIDQVIAEYQILRQTIFSVLETEKELSALERDVILNSIERAVNDAATEFSEHLKGLQENFSRTLIHDLRSPLSVALLSVEMFASSKENETHNEVVQKRITANLERVSAMLIRLLDFSTIRSDQGLKLVLEEICLLNLIEKIVSDYNFGSTNRFVVKVSPELKGNWDLRGVVSVLENLVTNALKYSVAETPIEISAERREGFIRIIVNNKGNVISPSDQGHLFQQYFRAKNANNEGGWGLGLPIVKTIVDAHGGHVTVESDEASGTSFIVKLPIGI